MAWAPQGRAGAEALHSRVWNVLTPQPFPSVSAQGVLPRTDCASVLLGDGRTVSVEKETPP